MFTVTVTPDSLHTRQGPGTAFDSIGFVKQSDRFTALAIDSTGTWLQVQQSSDKGLLGWCSARYLLRATVNFCCWHSPWRFFICY